jgi:ABC-type branched-subunit amino acid transport system permease subunit
VLVGIRVNEARVRSLGYPVFHYKLGAFVLAGMLAGLAGYLAACQFGFVNPEILSWHYSGIVLMMLLLGGMGRLYGAVIGAFAFVLAQELFSGKLHRAGGARAAAGPGRAAGAQVGEARGIGTAPCLSACFRSPGSPSTSGACWR